MGETVEFASNGGTASGYLATPSTGSGPGVIVLQEWWGLNPQIKRVADRLADDGFVALAPDLYHGDLAAHTEMDKAAGLMSALPPDRAARDMGSAVDYLVGLEQTTGSGIGVLGFCMGGMLTWLLACNRPDSVKVAVPFYGFPQGDMEPDWTLLRAKIQAHMADSDDFFPPDAARGLEAKLNDLGKDVDVTVHSAGHAFMNEDNGLGTHDGDLAARVWPEVLSFLHSGLG